MANRVIVVLADGETWTVLEGCTLQVVDDKDPGFDNGWDASDLSVSTVVRLDELVPQAMDPVEWVETLQDA